jgi:hypothetical protein
MRGYLVSFVRISFELGITFDGSLPSAPPRGLEDLQGHLEGDIPHRHSLAMLLIGPGVVNHSGQMLGVANVLLGPGTLRVLLSSRHHPPSQVHAPRHSQRDTATPRGLYLFHDLRFPFTHAW